MRACARSVATLLGLAFVLLVGGPASFAAAHICHTRLQATTPASAPGVVSMILLAVQVVYILALVPRLGVALGRTLPASLLRPFPVRPLQVVAAGMLGAIMDTPILFALPIFAVVACWLGTRASFAGILVACLILALLTLQSAALSQALEQSGRWILAAKRGWLAAAVILLILVSSFVWLPTASLTVAAPANGKSASVPPPVSRWIIVLPGGLAGQAIASAAQNEWGVAFIEMLALAASVPVTLWMAARIYASAEAYESASITASSRRKARLLSPSFASSKLSLSAAMFGLEWRCLLRDPAAYLPLRGPAMLLLLVFLGWIAPNVGDDPIVTFRDLICIGGLFYTVLWQLQLLCNRFGNEPGTAGLLLAFSVPRRCLLIGKNAALLGVLLPLDAAIILALCAYAHAAWFLAGTIIAITCALLAILTSIGNLVSVFAPFSIVKRGERFQTEPDRSLIFVYGIACGLSGAFCWGIGTVRDHTSGPVALLTAAGLLGIVYVVTLLLAERQLERRELRVIELIEGA